MEAPNIGKFKKYQKSKSKAEAYREVLKAK